MIVPKTENKRVRKGQSDKDRPTRTESKTENANESENESEITSGFEG